MSRPRLELSPVTAPSQRAAPARDPQPTPESPPKPVEQPPAPPANAARARSQNRARTPRPPGGEEQSSSLWREWGRFDQTVSFKWPAELAAELDDRRHDLREPVGLMVIAAVASLLDQDDDTIHRLIDRAEQAKPRAGRSRHTRT